MSYQALARVYRPQNFEELVGQEHVSQALKNGLDQDRIHHAFLFTGTRGVGKTTVARILAKALNCEQGVSGHPCGICSSCVEITEGRFVDLVEVDAASRTGVDDTRDLLENVQYAPTKGRYKIYLIDEVHMFSNSSFNALLKTLEEPPPHVKFLLATTEPKKLPVTVLSRCLQFNLKRLNLTQIKDHLAKLLKMQQVTFDELAVELIARAADGSMRDGLSLLDQALAFGAGQVSEKDVKLMLGTMDQDTVVSLMDCIIDNDSESLTKTLQQVFEMSPDYSRLLGDLALLLHEVSLMQVLNSFIDNSQFDRARIKNIVQNTTAEQVQLYYQIVIKGQEEIHLAPDSKTGFEMTIVRLFAFEIGQPSGQPTHSKSNQLDVTTAIADQSRQKNNSRTNPSQTTQLKEETTAYQAVVTTSKMKLSEITEDKWQKVFEQLKLKGMSRELARNAHVISNEDNKLVLAIDNQASTFMTESATNQLDTALKIICSEEFTLQLDLEDNLSKTIAKKEQVQQENSKIETINKVEQNPFVQHMQENFDAQVIQIKNGESFI
jgi:DNA polymerase-3 subunit gamma/tau